MSVPSARPWAALALLACAGLCAASPALQAEFSGDQPQQDVAPLSWDDAYAKARRTLASMTQSEKRGLLQGVGYNEDDWWEVKKYYYVGNTAGIPRLGIPSLNMQDGGSGFHSKFSAASGTATCWPSLLALAATWDPTMTRQYAVALGEEFSSKGANGILGPSVDVHRVARNGRNFEYLSGEDPYLGARLAEAYVAGVQSKGVFAVIKHWIFNTQETNREKSSSRVDERTAWELYYPPFEAAINAGASGVMCSYNRVNGIFSCENEEQLQSVLRERMNFRGFVQSDWWATHSLSIEEGLDQEMPGEGEQVFFSNQTELSKKSPAAIDAAATRILAVIYRMHLQETSKCFPPNCRWWLLRNVTSEKHTALAEAVATESIVMLRNEDGVLPIKPKALGGPSSILVVGSASVAKPFDPEHASQGQGDWSTGDYYSGGGSGHVVAKRFVTPLAGIRSRAEREGMRVLSSPTNAIQPALSAAKSADLIVVVVATTSGESKDRADLNLDDKADLLITALSLVANGKKIVVLMQVPGAVVLPWRGSVQGILAMFLGGQETGSAWGSVLFGDHSPTGRLPLAIPATEMDTIPPENGSVVNFAEALQTSYRHPTFRVAYPFGHGLSFSTFSYGALSSQQCAAADAGALICLAATVTNSGQAAAGTVAQLYLQFPQVAGYPAALLKGFVKTFHIEPGASQQVVFALTRRDVSYYVETSKSWAMADWVNASVGESSADLRRSMIVQLGPAATPGATALQPAPSSAAPPAPGKPAATATPAPTEDEVTFVDVPVGQAPGPAPGFDHLLPGLSGRRSVELLVGVFSAVFSLSAGLTWICHRWLLASRGEFQQMRPTEVSRL